MYPSLQFEKVTDANLSASRETTRHRIAGLMAPRRFRMMQKRNEKETEKRERRGEKILRNVLFYILNFERQKSIRTALSEKHD